MEIVEITVVNPQLTINKFMTWGPFNSEEGGKAIIDFLQKSIFPTVKEIHKTSLEIGDYKQGFLNSFFRSRLSRLQEEYSTMGSATILKIKCNK